jgi:hypothetical protein
MKKRLGMKQLILAMIILVSLIGGAAALRTTVNGPWGYTDPVVYLATARSLDRGEGLGYYEGDATFRPITIQPPFYPIVLSAIGLFGVDLVAAARWLNIFALVASIFLAGWIFYRHTRAPALGLIASVLLCVFPHMQVMFSSAYSEPLFILLFLSGGAVLLAYLQKGKTSLLVISALLIGMIPATRYAGIAMVFAGGASVLLLSAGTTRDRLRKAAWFSLLAGLPILLWLAWIYFSSDHSVGGRSLGLDWHGLSAQFQAFRGIFMDTIWKWVPFQSHEMLLRYRLRFIITGFGLVVMLALVLLAGRRLRKTSRDSAQPGDGSGMRVFAFFGLSSLLFLAVLVLTYLFTRPTIDVDNRMLLPLYVGSVMAFYAAFAVWQAAWFKGKLWLLRSLPWLVAAVCVLWYYPQTREKMEFYRAGDGLNAGLTAYRWDRAGIIQAVRSLPDGQPVISNDWELLLLWTGRPVHGFWNSFPAAMPIQSGAYGTLTDDPVQSLFCEQGAALVIFNDFPAQFQAHVGDTYLHLVPYLFAGLTVSGTYPDGKIYLCPK